ncbi:alpha/beta fold hydrolase [Modestobacter sp. I12A-02628]|uniref:Alpha/beta hydrolase n=1 Tax=Goekera deserti TaxID=2497753 RepID=A0A7K3WHJ9_9ACTN|nr:alpha/beta hydrolase [Goekera deserti]MPQ99070.1 alpha/beta fold hydrolase [Goekera deserti]NDI47404.1 alpha/beta fold hydrolase [Goekera deserti]NEL55934.1 alpha/beta hydrolase [Goekera deserti]
MSDQDSDRTSDQIGDRADDQNGGEDLVGPAWFRQSLAQVPEHVDVDVDGVRVHCRVWGRVGAPGLVLVHGGAAHSGWWDHVAPLLDTHRVVAVDLSGHGRSDRRPEYGVDRWASEVVGVIDALGLDRPVLVGHSMGGWVSTAVAADHPHAVSAVAVIDSPLNDRAPEQQAPRREHRVYPTLDAAVARFRTLPPQEVLLPYVRDHVARESLRPVEGGWTWAFDPAFFGRKTPVRGLLPRVAVPFLLLRCEHGLVSPAMAADIAGLLEGRLTTVDLPASGHHPMLDQPLALVVALRTLLAAWPPATGS